MKLFQITQSGLVAIGTLTMVLWGCFIGERALLRRSARNEYLAKRSMRELRLKRTFAPASVMIKPAVKISAVAVKIG